LHARKGIQPVKTSASKPLVVVVNVWVRYSPKYLMGRGVETGMAVARPNTNPPYQ